MTDLISKICSIRLEQNESPHLLHPNSFERWLNKAEDRVKHLETIKPAVESQEWIEADCLINNLDEIQQRRAELIWALAFDGAGNTSLMTQQEADLYRDLIGYAQELKGEAS